MRKAYKLEELCCANCANKIEEGINKLDGVNTAKVNFMTSKLMLDADPENLDAILDQCQKVCTKYEPDCIIVR